MTSERLRNSVGRAFALECSLRELWGLEGPTSVLRARVAQRSLAPHQLVLMRVALDFYDGSGGSIGFAEAARSLEGPAGMNALYFLGEFLGSALTDMPDSLESWASQYAGEIADAGTH